MKNNVEYLLKEIVTCCIAFPLLLFFLLHFVVSYFFPNFTFLEFVSPCFILKKSQCTHKKFSKVHFPIFHVPFFLLFLKIINIHLEKKSNFIILKIDLKIPLSKHDPRPLKKYILYFQIAHAVKGRKEEKLQGK